MSFFASDRELRRGGTKRGRAGRSRGGTDAGGRGSKGTTTGGGGGGGGGGGSAALGAAAAAAADGKAGGGGEDSVVDRARRLRLERAREKEERAALRVLSQRNAAWLLGPRRRRTAVAALREEVRGKLGDVRKLRRVLDLQTAATGGGGGQRFSVPPPAAVQILRSALFAWGDAVGREEEAEEEKLVEAVVEEVVLAGAAGVAPLLMYLLVCDEQGSCTAAEADAAGSERGRFVIESRRALFCRLALVCVRLLEKRAGKLLDLPSSLNLSGALALCCGTFIPDDSQFYDLNPMLRGTRPTPAVCDLARQVLLEAARNPRTSLFLACRAVFVSSRVGRPRAAHSILFRLCITLATSVGQGSGADGDIGGSVAVSDTGAGLGALLSPRPPQPPRSQSSSSSSSVDRTAQVEMAEEFTRVLLSVPLLTTKLDNAAVDELFTSSAIMDDVARFLAVTLRAGASLRVLPSPDPSFPSEMWLVGNTIATLRNAVRLLEQQHGCAAAASRAGADPAADRDGGDDVDRSSARSLSQWGATLTLLLHATRQLLDMSPPNLFSSRAAIVWSRDGSSMTASATPRELLEQVHMLAHPTVARVLARYIFGGLAEHIQGLLEEPFPQDLRALDEVKRKTGLEMAEGSVREETDASVIMSSKWAQRLVRNVTRTVQTGIRGVGRKFNFRSLFGGGTGSEDAATAGVDIDEFVNADGSAIGGDVVSGGESKAAPDAKDDRKRSAKQADTKAGAEEESNASEGRAGAQAAAANPDDDDVDDADDVEDEVAVCFEFSYDSAMIWCEVYGLLLGSNFGTGTDTPMWKCSTALTFSTDMVQSLLVLLVRFCNMDEALSSGSISFSTTVTGGAQREQRVAVLPCRGAWAALAAFTCLYSHLLITSDDREFFADANQATARVPLVFNIMILRWLRDVAFRVIWDHFDVVMAPAARSTATAENLFAQRFTRAMVRLLHQLYARQARRPFVRPEMWHTADSDSGLVLHQVRSLTPVGEGLLRAVPFCIPFAERIKLFQAWAQHDRAIHQPSDARGRVVRVRRNNIVRDGLDILGRLGPAIKERLSVRFIDDFGEEEMGIDVGGLFKDFWTTLAGTVFDVNYALFSVAADNTLYPNPGARMIHGQETEVLYEFLGRILGKALYEGMTVQPKFSHFFLSFMRTSYNFLEAFDELGTLDPDLYKNLLFLKYYEGDISDLCLTFTVLEDNLGEQREIPLVPGGAEMDVTTANRLRYINLVAKYHLYDKMRVTAGAFFRGLYQIINPNWIGIFNAPELQVLISGISSGIDTEDMRRNTSYANGYTQGSGTIRNFWKVVEKMTPAERASLLRFVTSCERPPTLGFGALNPPFTIHRIPDEERLPTASTCFNTLKLPTYSSERVLKSKLMTAIQSGSVGFYLS